MLFRDCCEKYRQYIDKLLKDGTYRYETHKSLASYLKNMMDWNDKRLIPITYIYQFDKDFAFNFWMKYISIVIIPHLLMIITSGSSDSLAIGVAKRIF